MRLFTASNMLGLVGVITAIGCGSTPTESTTTGGSGGSGGESTGTTGGGGSGGDTGTGGTGGETTCAPGETKSCYSGPAGTENVGLCKAGTEACKANGEGFGACTGAVLPQDETCETAGDDDCDGMANEEGGLLCSCVPGSTKDCYSSAPETKDVGPCIGGVQTCNASGMGYGECVGEVGPQAETCDTPEDDNCNGQVNEEGIGCLCVPGTQVACYTGPIGTLDVGECKAGTALCSDDGTAMGQCINQLTPSVETCFKPGDEDCDGESNEEGPGCTCTPGTQVACYTGPVGTLNIGQCKGGMQMCGPQGMAAGACVGEILPSAETCVTGFDDDCDGLTNEEGEACSCVPGATKACYSGPVGSAGVGVCKAGTQVCNPDGAGYGACANEVLPAAENCNTAANEDCSAAVDCGTQFWAKSFGAVGEQQGYAVTRDAQNNVIITGRFTGQMTFGGGGLLVSPVGYDIFVAKFNSNGDYLWHGRYGDAGIYQEGFDIATDANGNVFFTGYFDSTINFGGASFSTGGLTDMFVVKLDANGIHQWSKAFAAPSPQYGASLAVDPQGNVILLGNGFNTVDFGGGGLTSAGNYDMFVAKFDGANGNHLWSKRYGTAKDDRALGIAVDSAGNIVFTGRAEDPIDFGGGAAAANGSLDVLAVKLDTMGNHVWSKRFGDGGNQFGADVAIDAMGNVVLTGGFESSINFGGGALNASAELDVYVAKLTSAGNHVWSKRFGAGGANLALLALGIDTGGDVTAVGSLDGAVNFGAGLLTSNAGADAVVLHFGAATGNLLWGRLYGGPGNQYLSSVAPDSMKNLYLTGYFEQTIEFGGPALTSTGGLDIALAKLAP